MIKQYFVLNDKMYLKINGETTDIDTSLVFADEIEMVWKEFDEANRPFIYYSGMIECDLNGSQIGVKRSV